MKPHGLWKLLAKIMWGAGPRDRLRLVLQVVAVALAVICALLAFTMPMVFAAEQQRLADRQPVWVQPNSDGTTSATGVTLRQSDELYQGQVLSIWQLTIGPTRVALPPGLTSWPAPNHLVLSPRLLQDYRADPAVRARLPGVVDGTIQPAGLANPNELFAWSGADGGSGAPVASFGTSVAGAAGIAPDGGGISATVELIILVGLPLVGFAAAASRMAAGTRRARTSTLRLIGLSDADCRRLNGRLLAFVSAIGAALGCLAYQPISTLIGRSGVTGLSWFSSDTRIWWPVLVLIVVALAALGRSVGAATVRGTLDIRSTTTTRVSRRWLLLAAACGGVCLVYLAWTWWARSGTDLQTAASAHPQPVLVATVVLVVAMLICISWLSDKVSEWWVRRMKRAATVRLGLRLARLKPSGTVIALAAIGLMITVASLSSALMQIAVTLASGADQPIQVYVAARGLPPNQQRVLSSLLSTVSYPAYAQTGGQAGAEADSADVSILVGTCSGVQVMTGPLDQCTSGPVLVTSPSAPTAANVPSAPSLHAGDTLRIPLSAGGVAEVPVPSRTLSVDQLGVGGTVIFPPAAATWLAEVASVDFMFLVPNDEKSYDTLVGTLAQQVPNATISTSMGDPQARETWRQQRSLLNVATAVGFVFCLLSLVLLGIGMGQDQARSLTSLQLVGVTRGRLRCAVALSKAFPVVIATVGLVVIAGLSGQALLAVAGLGGNLRGMLWWESAVFALVGIAVAAVMGAALVGKLDLSQPDVRE